MKDKDCRVNCEHCRNIDNQFVFVGWGFADELCDAALSGTDKYRGTTGGLLSRTPVSSSDSFIGRRSRTSESRVSMKAVSQMLTKSAKVSRLT